MSFIAQSLSHIILLCSVVSASTKAIALEFLISQAIIVFFLSFFFVCFISCFCSGCLFVCFFFLLLRNKNKDGINSTKCLRVERIRKRVLNNYIFSVEFTDVNHFLGKKAFIWTCNRYLGILTAAPENVNKLTKKAHR